MRPHTTRVFALGVITGSMLTAGIALLAAPAKAEPDRVAVAYAAQFAPAVCDTLDDYPTVNGILGIGQAIMDDGLTPSQAGSVVALSVGELCPWHRPLIRQFVAQFGPGRVVA